MKIHELNTRTPGVYDYAALDTGSQTYKAKVGDLKPQYVSYDSANPTSWAEVATMGSNTPISTFFERVTYIARNVRYLWKLIGSGDFSNVSETISGTIGNTALTTTATSLSGAIAEHEEDISTINGNLSELSGNVLPTNSASMSLSLQNCTGDITGSLYLSVNANKTLMYISGRVRITNFARTAGNPGVVFNSLPFTALRRVSSMVGYRGESPVEMASFYANEGATTAYLTTTESYSNAANGTLTLMVPGTIIPI